jgi:hypothetical protein
VPETGDTDAMGEDGVASAESGGADVTSEGDADVGAGLEAVLAT